MFLLMTKRRLSYVLAVLLIAASAIATIYWIFNSTFSITSEPAEDYWERVLDTQIMVNGNDFSRWYKLNIVMQILAITCGIGATVVASLTSTANANTAKYITIALTSITSFMIAVQSSFHIRENLSAYIQVNTALVNLQHEYLLSLSDLARSGKTKQEIELETAKKYSDIQEIRWRSYAIIGQVQQPRSDASLGSETNKLTNKVP